MSRKIIGATVGTPLSTNAIADKLKPVKTVNNVSPDYRGNVSLEVLHGKDGKDGKEGVGIATFKQTVFSTEDGGNNIIRYELTDGTSNFFIVKNGNKGSTGANGKDGTSVTVHSVRESTVDGSNNLVIFSDGKILTVKNGSKGDPGKTPVKGTDYYTEDDKAEMVEAVLAALPAAEGVSY